MPNQPAPTAELSSVPLAQAASNPVIDPPATGYRWVILTLVFFAITINYIDRMVIGLLAPDYLKEPHGVITELQYGYIGTAFGLSYAIGQLISGRWLDWIGTRKGYAIALGAWSVASMLHAIPRTALGFGVARSILGVTESPAYPAATKTLAEWFPRRERALAMGFVNAGSNVGAVVAPIMVPLIAAAYGWRETFFITGAIGLVWLLFWIPLYRRPQERPAGGMGFGLMMVLVVFLLAAVAFVVSEGVLLVRALVQRAFDLPSLIVLILSIVALVGGGLLLRLIYRGVSASEVAHIHGDPPEAPGKVRWLKLLTFPQAWAFVAGKFLTDPVWSFYLFWLPSFLKQQHGLSGKQVMVPMIVIYLLADIGSIGGGWLSSTLIQRGLSVNAARKTTLFVCACLVVPAVFATAIPGVWSTVAIAGLALAAHQGFSANLYTLVSDMFPKRAVGSVAGLGGFFGYVGFGIFSAITGWILEATGKNYLPVFIICGSSYLLAFALIHLLAPRLEQVRLEDDVPPPPPASGFGVVRPG